MEMKNLVMLLLLSISLSLSNGFATASLSEECSSAWKTCFVHRGFPPYSSECCDAIRNIDPQCFGRLGYIYPKIMHACQTPPPPPPPEYSSECPFVDACNVKSRGFWPTYNISNPECCKIVQASLFPKGKCFGYTPIFFKIKGDCYSQPRVPSTPPPPPPQVPPPNVVPPTTPPPEAPVPPTPPPEVPPTAPSTSPTISSSSCAFIEACGVEIVGSSYSYNLNSKDSLLTCCRVVRGIHGDLGSDCSGDIYGRALTDIQTLCYTVPPVKY